MTRRIIAIDTETASITGPVCELAIIDLDENLDILGSMRTLIDPQVPIAPAAQVVHKITDQMVTDSPTMSELIERDGNPFHTDEGTELVVIAHNAQFDCRMLADVLPEKYTRICTLKMARKIWPDIEKAGGNHKLEVLALMFGLDSGNSHSALDDTMTVVRLLRHMAKITKASSFGELISLGRRELTGEDKLNFGAKHRDDKIKDVPKSYISWMFKNVTDMDPDLRICLEAMHPNLR